MDKKPTAGSVGATGRDVVYLRQAGNSVVPDCPDVPRVSGAVHTHSQRVSPRKTLPCTVLVNIGGTYVIARTIHDISLVGAFIEIDSTDLAVGGIVDVVMEFDDRERTTDIQLSAEVARIDEQGVGLRFHAYGDRTYTDLVNLLYAR